MSDDPVRTTDMVDITDCFEAVRVFRTWRNLFFAVVVACLLLLQAIFWLVDMGWMKPPAQARQIVTGTASDQTTAAVSQAPDGNSPASAVWLQREKGRFLGVSFEQVARLVRVTNGVLLLAAMLYWLTQLFTLVISIAGRLGGMNHICRAFFLSLIVMVLLFPWQHFLDSILVGATFGFQELANGFAAKTASVEERIVYYLRFSGYSLVVLALLILAHLRSIRWAKAILRRLEII